MNTINKINTINSTIFTTSLTQAIADCKNWHVTLYTASNEALYKILAGCYAMSCELADNIELQATFSNYLKEHEIKTKSSTTIEYKIIKVVFADAAKQRLSTYAKVLLAANKANVEQEALADWITKAGGIQEIKLAESKSGLTSNDKLIKGEEIVTNGKAFYTMQGVAKNVDEGTNVVLVGRVKDNGDIDIVKQITNDIFMKNVMIHIAVNEKEKLDTGEVVEQAKVKTKVKLKATKKTAKQLIGFKQQTTTKKQAIGGA